MAADARLFTDDTVARRRALDVLRSFIVQAPAGSGKTGLLIQRYLKLLPTVEEPEEILAITFTRKAAAEMQIRVLQAMRDARDGVVAEHDHHQLTLGLAAEALACDRARSWQLMDHPRRMRIQTLDAFSAGITRSLPFTSGLGGSSATLADAEMRTLYRRAAAATLDWLAGPSERRDFVECVLAHLDNNTQVYIEHIARMLETRDQWLQIVGSGLVQADASSRAAVRARLERNVELAIAAHLDRVHRRVPADVIASLVRLGRYAADNIGPFANATQEAFAISNGLPGAAAGDLSLWRAIAALLLTGGGDWRKRIDARIGFPAADDGEAEALQSVIETLSSDEELRTLLLQVRTLPDPGYGDEQWQVLEALFGVLPVAVAELRRLFGERGVNDHIEVALAAGTALGHADEPGEIALALDYTVRHVLIDEMQDTSIGQYGLIEKLVSGWEPGDGRTLFCVGDPMQSIYRFRDAEVGQFLLARRAGIGPVQLEPLVLRRNFRSGERLVHWFNSAFSRILPAQDDVAEGAIAYSESVPVEQQHGQGAVEIHPLFGGDANEEAECGVDVIRACLAASNEDNVAVLVRSRSQLPGLLTRLRASGLAYEAVEIDRLTDLPEIIDLLALTRALCHDGDRIAWLALLRGPWVGLTWADLHAIVVNDSSSTVPELLNDRRRIETLSPGGRDRVADFLSRIGSLRHQDPCQSLRERIEAGWYALDGPRLLQQDEQFDNVYRYFDVLDRIETAGTLADPAELESRLDDERISTTGDGDCRLQVLTMHKAKGLQFDHVVLYGLGRYPRGRDKSVLGWLYLPEEHGQGDMIISPIGPRYELEHDKLHQFIEDTEKRKDARELDRLLYVGCTRARRSLHLIGHVSLARDEAGYRQPHPASLLARLWPAVEERFASAFVESGSGADDGTEDGPRLLQPELRRHDAGRAPPPPPLPGRAASVDAAEDGLLHPVRYDWVGRNARSAGTIVHRWLRRLADGEASLTLAGLPDIRATNVLLARDLGVEDRDVGRVCERVETALRAILDDEAGQWLLAGDGHAELALTGRWQGRTASIVIDRVRIDEDGAHWVVDYKTSTHEGGDLAGFLEQEADRHREQLEKYGSMYRHLVGPTVRVRTALYFPLLQEFVEVRI